MTTETHTYTEQDVRDANYAYVCEIDAISNEVGPEESATFYLETAQERNVALARLHRGQEILANARLVTGGRYARGTANPSPLTSPDAPTVLVDAGYIANQEAVREITLVIDTNYVTTSRAAAISGLDESTWRYRLLAGNVPGAIKRGKTWLIPRNQVEIKPF